MTESASSAIILARGLGTRMRKADPSATVGAEEAAAAEKGVKAMIPVGRPFLDFVLSALADAGFTRACIVIGPEHDAVRDHYSSEKPKRISIEFAVQQQPLGTADAVLAAEDFTRGEPFAVLNSDNYYPPEALAALRAAPPPALVAFETRALLDGNVPPERVGRFGQLDIDENGFLRRIAVVKPGQSLEGVYASMNCWLFTSGIFEACRKVTISPRGELELPRAVQLAIDEMRMQFTTVRVAAPVLDLSTRADIAAVKRALQRVDVTL